MLSSVIPIRAGSLDTSEDGDSCGAPLPMQAWISDPAMETAEGLGEA